MAESLANVSLNITIDKRSISDQITKGLDAAQKEINNKTITYQIAADEAQLRTLKERIEKLSPEIRAGIIVEFSEKQFNKSLDKLNGYAGKKATDIGKDFIKNLNHAVSGKMSEKDFAKSVFGEGAKGGYASVIKGLKNELNANFDINKVGSLNELEKYATTIKQLDVALKGIGNKSVTGISASSLEKMRTTVSQQLKMITDNAGIVIEAKAPVWMQELQDLASRDWSQVINLINSLKNGLNFETGSGGGTGGFGKIEDAIADVNKQLDAAIEKKREFEQGSAKFNLDNLTKAWRKIGEANVTLKDDNNFVEAFQNYIKYGGDIKKINKDIIEDYNYYDDNAHFLPIQSLRNELGELQNIDAVITELTKKRDELLTKQQEASQGSDNGESIKTDLDFQKSLDRLNQELVDIADNFGHNLNDVIDDFIKTLRNNAEVNLEFPLIKESLINIAEQFKNSLAEASLTPTQLDEAYKMIKSWNEASRNMALNGGVDAERAAYFNSSTGKTTNGYVFDSNGSFDLKILHQIAQKYIGIDQDIGDVFDTFVHSHPYKSEGKADKVQVGANIGFSVADFEQFITEFSQGIKKMMVTSKDKFAQFDFSNVTEDELKRIRETWLQKLKELGYKLTNGILTGTGEFKTTSGAIDYDKLSKTNNQILLDATKDVLGDRFNDSMYSTGTIDELKLHMSQLGESTQSTTEDAQKLVAILNSISESLQKINDSGLFKFEGIDDVIDKLNSICTKLKIVDEETQTTPSNPTTTPVAGNTNQDTSQEQTAMISLAEKVDAVTTAVDAKTAAFQQEEQTVVGITQHEITELEALDGQLTILKETLEKFAEISVKVDVQIPEKIDSESLETLKQSLQGDWTNNLQNIGDKLTGFKITSTTAENLQKLANAILTLKSNLNNVSNGGFEFLNGIKELVKEGENLKSLATVIKATKDEITKAKSAAQNPSNSSNSSNFNTADADKMLKLREDFIAAAKKSKIDFNLDDLKIGANGVITFTSTVEKLGEEAVTTKYKLEDFYNTALNKDRSLSKTNLKKSAVGVSTKDMEDKEVKALIAAQVKQYNEDLQQEERYQREKKRYRQQGLQQEQKYYEQKQKNAENYEAWYLKNITEKERSDAAAEQRIVEKRDIETAQGKAAFAKRDSKEIYTALSQATQEYIHWLKEESIATGDAKAQIKQYKDEALATREALLNDIHHENSPIIPDKEKELELDRQILQSEKEMQVARSKSNTKDVNKASDESYARSAAYLKEIWELRDKIANSQETNSKTQSADVAGYEKRIQQLKELLNLEQEQRKNAGLNRSDKNAEFSTMNANFSDEYLRKREVYNASLQKTIDLLHEQALAENAAFDNIANQKRYKQLQEESKNKQKIDTDNREQTANDLLQKQRDTYEAIYQTQIQISNIDKNDENAKARLAFLEEQKKKLQEQFVALSQQLGAYDDIIDKQKQLDGLLAISKSAKPQLGQDAKDLAANYDKLEKTLIDINALQIKIANGKSTDELKDQQKLNTLKQEQTQLEKNIEEFQKKGVTNAEAALHLAEQKNAIDTDYANKTSGTVFGVTKNRSNNYEMTKKIDAGNYIETDKIIEAKQLVESYYKQITDGSARSKDENDKLNKSFDDQITELRKLTSADQVRNPKSGNNYIGKLTGSFGNIKEAKKEVMDLMKSIHGANAEFVGFTKGYQGMIVSVKNKDGTVTKYKASLDAATGAVRELATSENVYMSAGAQWISGVKNKIKELTQYMTGIGMITRVFSELKNGFVVVKDLDTALTEMRKVSNETVSSLKAFQKESFGIADSVGATAKTIQDSTADWMRLGEEIDDAKKSAATANILLNVSEFENINDATESLVAMSQAYTELEKIDIVDKLNNVGEQNCPNIR